MRVQIETYTAVVKSFTYLEHELVKRGLERWKAILYFQILLNEEENETVERPHFTFVLEGFDKYLRFFKHYNFIDSAFNANTFSLFRDWKDNHDFYALELSEEEPFLQISEQYDELNSYYRILA